MNYRHAFHAGNFADAVKHAVLIRVLLHLRKKPAAFRVIDTHAGAGLYDLTGSEAVRGGEWQDGIGKLWDATPSPAVAPLVEDYLAALRAHNPQRLARYPGSPILIRHFLRPQDRLIACELEPKAAAALTRQFGQDHRVKAIAIDGWTALSAYIPPKERRGLVLIDPPFEEKGELQRLAKALAAAHAKWPTGIFMAWYPIKDTREAAAFARSLSSSGPSKMLQAEVGLSAAHDKTASGESVSRSASGRLRGTGLILINPPWTLESELRVLLPALAGMLSPDRKGHARLAWLSP